MEMLVESWRLMAHVSYINGYCSGDQRTIEPCGRPLYWNAVCIRVSHVQQANVSVVARVTTQGQEKRNAFHLQAKSVSVATDQIGKDRTTFVDGRLDISSMRPAPPRTSSGKK